MVYVKVVLTEFVDDRFPSVGAFEFTDLQGETIVIHEKLCVVGLDEAGTASQIPMNVGLECMIVSETHDHVMIDTSAPYAIEDVQGRTQFQVSPNLVGR